MDSRNHYLSVTQLTTFIKNIEESIESATKIRNENPQIKFKDPELWEQYGKILQENIDALVLLKAELERRRELN